MIKKLLFMSTMLLLLLPLYVFPSNRESQGIYIGTGQNRKLAKGQLLKTVSPKKHSPNSLRLEDITVTYKEDFESGAEGWRIEGGVWEIGVPSSGPSEAHSDSCVAGTVLDGEYPNDASAVLISPELYVPNGKNVKLSFWHWYNMETDYDHGYLKISFDGKSWFVLRDFTGSSEGWTQEEVNLEIYAGQKIYIAFHLITDYSVTYYGWYIDDIMITIEGSLAPLSMSLVNFDFGLFPQLYATVTVDSMGIGTPNLNEENFYVYENNVFQTENYSVAGPNESGGIRTADVVFVLDVSGSMGEEIESVRNNMKNFVNLLAESGIDYRVGFVTYADWDYVYNNGNLYSNLSDILSVINNIELGEHDIGNGGDSPENPYYALYHAAQMNFRPGAQKVLIMITDADAHTVDDPGDAGEYAIFTDSSIVSLLVDAGCKVFPVFDTWDTHQRQQYIPIAKATQGGIYFDVTSPFDIILSYISSLLSRNYVITYRSSNPELDGKLRNVMIVVFYWGYYDTVYTSYTPGSLLEVRRTKETAALSDTVWEEKTTFEIRAIARKTSPPDVQSVNLFYRNTGSSSYQRVAMEHVRDSLWSYTLPDTVAKAPGIDYYLSATDGINTVTDPPIDPAENPFQIAVLPNSPPYISHTPPRGYFLGLPIEIKASVVDTTEKLENVELYYKNVGQLVYNKTDMEKILDDFYIAVIPGEHATESGIEYYIKATDNYGFSTIKHFSICPFPPTRESWFVNISATSKTAWDIANYAGVSPYARDALDTLDVPEPPGPVSNYISLYFPHPEWEDPLGPNYMIDCRASRDLTYSVMEWEFNVKTDLSDTITIQILPGKNFPDKYLIVLHDISGGRKRIINRNSSYSYVASGEVRNFRLTIGKLFMAKKIEAGWHLVGSSIIPDSISLYSMNDKSIRDKLYVYRFAPDTGYIVSDFIKPGKGFWLGALEDINIGVYGMPPEDTVGIKLNKYWNIISNPFMTKITSDDMLFSLNDTVVSCDSAVALGWISPGLYGFNGTGYLQSDSLMPWNGYWFASLRDGLTLKMILPDTTKPALPKSTILTEENPESGWFVTIKASTKDGKATDELLSFGLRLDATGGFDVRYDLPKPPIPPSEYIRTYFYHPEWGVPLGPYFAYDIKSADSSRVSWKFYIETGYTEAQEIELTWTPDNLPEGVNLTLIDKNSGANIDMLSTASYTFSMASEGKAEFEIETVMSSAHPEETSVPKNFALYQNYPNPFNPTTTIKFDIPKEVNVTLTLFNITGRKVRTLINKTMEPGSYTLHISCSDLSSGIYFYQIRAGNFIATRKMVIIK